MPDYLKAAKASSGAKRDRLLRKHHEHHIRQQVLDCTKCGLRESCNAPVPWSGPTTAKIVLVGEAPGANEDRLGVPFVGQAGNLLNSILKSQGLDRDQTMVLNTVACRPPENRKPAISEQAACRSNLRGQLELCEAFVGVCMGKAAIEAISGAEVSRVAQWRGVPFWFEGRVWVPTYHPAYILRNRTVKFELEADIAMAIKLAERYDLWPTIEPKDLGRSHFADEVRERLNKQGWCALWSDLLDTKIVITLDEKITPPYPFSDLVHYTLAELVSAGLVNPRIRSTPRDVHMIHHIKSELGGRIVG